MKRLGISLGDVSFVGRFDNDNENLPTTQKILLKIWILDVLVKTTRIIEVGGNGPDVFIPHRIHVWYMDPMGTEMAAWSVTSSG